MFRRGGLINLQMVANEVGECPEIWHSLARFSVISRSD